MSSSIKFSKAGIVALVCGALLVAVAAAGCEEKHPEASGASPEASGASPSMTGSAEPHIKVRMIYQSDPSEPSLRMILNGIQQAGSSDVDVSYARASSTDEQADSIQKAIDDKIDGVALVLTNPQPLKEIISKAQKAGVSVAGLEPGSWKSMKPPVLFVGMPDAAVGSSAGAQLSKEGLKHVICVIQDAAVEDRCAGVQKAFKGKTETLRAGTNDTSLTKVISAKLQQDPSIDAVFTAGSSGALPATQAVAEARSRARVATFGLNEETVAAIRSEKIDFAVDIHFFMQGWLALRLLQGQEHLKNDETLLSRPAIPQIFDRSALNKIDKLPQIKPSAR
ncbi:substrate-binding domain-containing protein [Streptomyces sp. NPDC101151]|uniref:substrate-binding domain-containing protein n=1 Tax=Streptomyces sp. NPDC101151 TaxID=3366115 RepID=UPI0038128A83